MDCHVTWHIIPMMRNVGKDNIMKARIMTVAAVMLFGCTSWIEAQDSKSLFVGEEISQVYNYTSIDMEYVIGRPHVELIGSASDFKDVQFTLTDGKLHINGDDYATLKIRIYGNNLEGFSSFGSGDFSARRITSVSVMLASYGSGDIEVDAVDCTGLQLGSYGSGDVTLTSAVCKTAKLFVNGAGDLNIRKVNAGKVDVGVYASGDIILPSVTATTLNVSSFGSGNITVGGKVDKALLAIYGSGDIDARKLKYTKITKSQIGAGDIY